jgi:hypothetical protein
MNEQDDHLSPAPDVLLVEYQAAQDSAQHHDNLVWTTTGIIWGSSLVLLGFVLANLTTSPLKLVITALSALGLLLCAFVWTAAVQFGSVKSQKYNRCKEIEQLLGLKQHSELQYKSRAQRTLYAVTMSAFVVTWIVVLLTVWLP